MMKLFLLLSVVANVGAAPSFSEFDARARRGDKLTVVFFGASLTWGANATDPALTSYRALVADRLEGKYPRAHFKFYDAAIGGTGSQLGVFRLDRDVLQRKPDLVFLDFSANDDITSGDPEASASYESLVRRLVVEAKVPVVQVIFPFKWNATPGTLGGMRRRDAHLAIAKAYNTVVGDAIALVQERIKAGQVTAEQVWNVDAVHPGDAGYRLFADVVWDAFLAGVKNKIVCRAPEKMLFADTYMHQARVRIATLVPLPPGWRTGKPNLTAAFHDALMSRWLDDVAIAGNTNDVGRLTVAFSGSMVLFFGEETLASGHYRVYIDGQPVTHVVDGKRSELFDASAKRFGGNRHHTQVIATGLDATREHTLAIEPVFTTPEEKELRLESICVAGGAAAVRLTE